MDFMSVIQQYLAPLVQWFAALFTPAEWKAFVLLIAVTMAVTQIVKVGWRVLPIPADRLTYRHSILYLLTCATAFIAAALIWPPGFSWWIPGVIGGPASALTFKVGFALLRKFAPEVAASINADRRRDDRGPPGGIARRKTDSAKE